MEISVSRGDDDDAIDETLMRNEDRPPSPSRGAKDPDSSPDPEEQPQLSPLAAAARILAEGPPQLPESMSRYAHALPDLSSFGSEQEDAPLPEIRVEEEPDIWRTRGERLARTLFGAVLTCHCEVNDEVRLTVWLLGLVAGLICLGFFIAETRLHVVSAADITLHERVLAISLGGAFALVACLLTYVQIKDHLRNWVHPPSQRCVIRILLMVPMYCVSAWLSLVFTRYSLYLDFIRGPSRDDSWQVRDIQSHSLSAHHLLLCLLCIV